MKLLTVEPMEAEIGYAIIPLIDPAQGGDMLDRIGTIRKQMAIEMGIVVPPIRIRDNIQIKPTDSHIILPLDKITAIGIHRSPRQVALVAQVLQEAFNCCVHRHALVCGIRQSLIAQGTCAGMRC